jgi:hypothetical protein
MPATGHDRSLDQEAANFRFAEDERLILVEERTFLRRVA